MLGVRDKGFTLIELIIVTALIAVLIVMILMTINPIEQLKRATEAGRRVYANELLRGVERYQATEGGNPLISPIVQSITCSEIAEKDPVTDIKSLDKELSDWFPGKIMEKDYRLYVGLLPRSGLIKICYPVESAQGIAKATYDGCLVNSKFFLCLPD